MRRCRGASGVLVVALTTALAVGGCSSAQPTSQASASSSVTASTPAGVPDGPATPDGPRTGGPDDPPSLSTSPPAALDGVTATAPPYPHATLTDASRAAVRGLRTWARPALSYRRWWAALRPLLSAAGAQAYADTDPARLPALRVTGPAAPRPVYSPLLARVAVTTSMGLFGVELTRTDPTAGWLVSRIDFPTSVGTG